MEEEAIAITVFSVLTLVINIVFVVIFVIMNKYEIEKCGKEAFGGSQELYGGIIVPEKYGSRITMTQQDGNNRQLYTAQPIDGHANYTAHAKLQNRSPATNPQYR